MDHELNKKHDEKRERSGDPSPIDWANKKLEIDGKIDEKIVKGKISNVKFIIKKNVDLPNVGKFAGKGIDKKVESVEIIEEMALHVRPLAQLIERVSTFKSKVKLEKDDEIVDVNKNNGISLLTFGITKCLNGQTVNIIVEGPEAEREIIEVVDFLNEEKIAKRIQKNVKEESKFDLEKMKDINKKIELLNHIIDSERDKFLHLLSKDVEEKIAYNFEVTENELDNIASELCRLANLKGIKNDILKLIGREIFEPLIQIETSLTSQGAVFNVKIKETKITINCGEISKRVIKKFDYRTVIKPLDDFTNDLMRILEKKHVAEFINQKFQTYYGHLKEFLMCSTSDFSGSLSKLLESRMNYEHHHFVDIEESDIEDPGGY